MSICCLPIVNNSELKPTSLCMEMEFKWLSKQKLVIDVTPFHQGWAAFLILAADHVSKVTGIRQEG